MTLAIPRSSAPGKARNASLIALVLLGLAACSKTPKQQAIAGFMESCNAIDMPAVGRYCRCMKTRLDEAIPARTFNDPDADPVALMNGFGAEVGRLAPACKREAEE